jgi:D-3-phosphoglycerate dehydrogenase
MSYRVAISQTDYPDADVERQVLSAVDADVVVGHATTEAELVELAAGADGLIVQYADVTASVLDALEGLRVVSRYGVGVDTVDVEAATERGVLVTNVPSYCEEEVATHALSLLLTVVRRTAQYDDAVAAGTWDWKVGRPIRPLVGGTLGFVGYGSIPRRLTDLTAGFDFEYLAFDPYLEADDVPDAVRLVDFERLLDEADAVSVHAPLTESTRGLFDADAFARMRDTAVLVNTARGPIVDEVALRAALEAGELAGAGLDVLADEPVHDSPLFDRDDVVVTPHAAWYSERSLTELRRKAAENVRRVFRDEQPHGAINEHATER